MIEYHSTVKENGRGYAEEIARELESQGCEILDIYETMVPRGEGSDGKPYYVEGYQIVVDNGRPPLYRGYLYTDQPEVVNENLQDPPGCAPVSQAGYPTPWLWR